MQKKVMSAVLLMTTCAAQAQNCPTGIPSAGNPGCIPPSHGNSPYYRGTQSTTPPVEILEPRWGAVAIDYKNGAFGAVSNIKSKEEAKKKAISSCIRNGGAEEACAKDAVEYSNKCGVLVESADFTVFFTGKEQEKTRLDALWACDQRSQKQCEILFAECSYQAKVRVR